MPMYSHSRLRVYETCPRQYRFRYVERVKVPRVETVEMFLGSRVHDALEALYGSVKVGRVPSLDELLTGYRKAWEAQWTDSIQISRSELTPADYLATGARHLSAYHTRYQPFDQERTVAVERRIGFPLDEARKIWLYGYIDRLSVTRDGVWQIRDYKTGQWLPTQQDVDADRQLALYQIGVQRHFPRHARVVELIWHYVAHDLEMRSRREPAALRELEARTLGLIEAIQTDTTWAMVEGKHCHRCSYQSVCPAWSHLFRKEAAQLELAGPSEDGAVLVDRLAALHAERRALDARIARTEAELVAYAAAAGISSVFGSTHRARISLRHMLAYPRKGDPARDALERLIKAGGRWEEVSRLSLQLVARKAAEGAWPADLAERVRGFAQPGERTRVALSRRPDSAE
jgi:putative RecB family exonuclease